MPRTLIGQINSVPSSVEIIGGSLAFSPLQTGFKIIYKDSTKNEIGSYYIENPLWMQRCDDPNSQPPLKKITMEPFFIQIPYSELIRYCEINDVNQKEQKPLEFNISEFVKSAPSRIKKINYSTKSATA